jgi:hypothetical protein
MMKIIPAPTKMFQQNRHGYATAKAQKMRLATVSLPAAK